MGGDSFINLSKVSYITRQIYNQHITYRRDNQKSIGQQALLRVQMPRVKFQKISCLTDFFSTTPAGSYALCKAENDCCTIIGTDIPSGSEIYDIKLVPHCEDNGTYYKLTYYL